MLLTPQTNHTNRLSSNHPSPPNLAPSPNIKINSMESNQLNKKKSVVYPKFNKKSKTEQKKINYEPVLASRGRPNEFPHAIYQKEHNETE